MLGLRIFFALTGACFIAGALVKIARYFLCAVAGVILSIACLQGVAQGSAEDRIVMLVFLALSVLLATVNTFKAFDHIRQKRYEKAAQMPMLDIDSDGNVLIRTPADLKTFRAYYEPIREIYTKVAGVTYSNNDGTHRQAILAKCRNSDMLRLEPFTHCGDPAYAVWTRHGQIGNLSADDAAMISTVYADFVTLAEIKEITGGKRGQYYGCNLVLTVYQSKSETQPVPERPDDIELPENAELTESLIYAAVDIIFETNQVSVSLLQRRLRCGYATAARILDELEDAGVVGPYRGSQTPAILLTRAGWEALNYHYPPRSAVADNVDPAFIAEAQWHATHNDDK